MNICYPAVFHCENKEYWVEFPDLEGCFSDGKTIEEAYENSKDALAIYLDKSGELNERKINKPSSVSKVIKMYPNETVMAVE